MEHTVSGIKPKEVSKRKLYIGITIGVFLGLILVGAFILLKTKIINFESNIIPKISSYDLENDFGDSSDFNFTNVNDDYVNNHNKFHTIINQNGTLRLNKWEDVEFNINIPSFTNGKQLGNINSNNLSNIGLNGNGFSFNWYFKDFEGVNSLEYEIILNEVPESNKIDFPISSSNLSFYYQPPLDEEIDIQGISCNSTYCYNETSLEAFTSRPTNVVGSYAVYHDSKSNNEYKTGKAFHIYRPFFTDANENKYWGTINIANGYLTITFNQKDLDNAVYPIVVDPTIGYTSAGASGPHWDYGNTIANLADTYVASADDYIRNYSLYAYVSTGTRIPILNIYNITSGHADGLLADGITVADLPAISTLGWWNTTLIYQPLVAGQNYTIASIKDSSSAVGWMYDSSTGTGDYSGTAGVNPDPFNVGSSNDYRRSIYANYVNYPTYPCSNGMCVVDYSHNPDDIQANYGNQYGGTFKWDFGPVFEQIDCSNIINITLKLYIELATGAIDNDATVYFVDNETWDDSIDTTGWTSLYGQVDGSDNTKTFTSITAEYTNLSLEGIITDFCDSGNTNFSIILQDSDQLYSTADGITNTDTINFGYQAGRPAPIMTWSSSEALEVEQRPRLYIEYDEPEEVDFEGYWVLRSPYNDTNFSTGYSQPRRNGAELGNWHDVGVAWRNDTLDDGGNLLREEKRFCSGWTQYFLDETGTTTGAINDIYIHGWMEMQPSALGKSTVGLSVNEDYDNGNATYYTPLVDTMAYPYNATQQYLAIFNKTNIGYSFTSASEFNNISVKYAGQNLATLSFPNQKAFLLINTFNGVNLSNYTGLNTTDYDGDGLTDYEELYKYYCDPTDTDTDDDGHSDENEVLNNKHCWDPYDWGIKHIYYAYNGTIYAQSTNDSSQELFPEDFNDPLSGEISDYTKALEWDKDFSFIPFSLDTTNYWSAVQFNINWNVTQNVEGIINLNVYDNHAMVDAQTAGIDISQENVTNQNVSDDYLYIQGADMASTFHRQYKQSEIDDVIDDDGFFRYRVFHKIHTNDGTNVDWKIGLDRALLEVITSGSSINITNPTEVSLLTTIANKNERINFTLIEDGVTIISGASIENISIFNSTHSSLCTLNGVANYDSGIGQWIQNCTMPELGIGTYNITIFGNTSTSGFLNDTEENSISYIINPCIYSGIGDWFVECSDNCVITSPVDGLGNTLILNGTGSFITTSSIYNFKNIIKSNTCPWYSLVPQVRFNPRSS